jgi:thiol-disulfide isomerase/thioredoxin
MDEFRRAILIGAAAAAWVGVAIYGSRRLGERPAAASPAADRYGPPVLPHDRRPAGPRLTGELLDGSAFAPATLGGRVAVVNFWASWCAPCRDETADLEAVHLATRKRGVAFLGIDVRDDVDRATAFQRGRMTYPSLYDPAGRVALRFERVPPSTIPATVLLDRRGRIAALFVDRPTALPRVGGRALPRRRAGRGRV